MYRNHLVLLLFIAVCFSLQAQSNKSASKTDTTDLDKFKGFLDREFSDSNYLQSVHLFHHKNKYGTQKSEYVSKIPLLNLENSQAYFTISQEQIKDQIAIDYTDIFKTLPGTEVPAAAANGRVDISSRGFKVRSHIIDGLSGYNMSTIDPANIDHIEVISGPSSTLYGSSLTSYGGMVNIVTKKPYRRMGGDLSYYLNNFGLNRLTLDSNTPVNKKRNLLFRVNVAGELGKTYEDVGFNRNVFVAPSLAFKPNENVTLRADFSYYKRRATSPFWFSPYKEGAITDVRELELPYKHSFGNEDVYYNTEQFNARLRADIKLGEHWTSRTGLSYTKYNMNGQWLALSGISDSTLTHKVYDGPRHNSTVEVQQNFSSDYDFGDFRNRLLIGLDFYHYDGNSSTTTVSVDPINFQNPGADYGSFNKTDLDGALAQADYKTKKSEDNTYSAYLSDIFSIDDRWHLSAALRLDHFDNRGTRVYEKTDDSWERKGKFDQTALSPKFGAVYEAIPKKVSLYANYMNGFSNVNGSDYEGRTFKPEQANQWEAGVKWSLFHEGLTGRLSAYNIEVTDIVRDDLDHINYKIQDGKRLSRGVEFTTAWNPIPQFNMIAGYAYNYSKYQRLDFELEGRRPDGAGPEHTANLWLNYRFTTGILSGLKIGLGGRYGSNLVSVKHFTSRFDVPSYTVLNAAIQYTRDFYTIGVKLNNLNDETYWNNRLMRQPPRSIMGKLTIHLGKL